MVESAPKQFQLLSAYNAREYRAKVESRITFDSATDPANIDALRGQPQLLILVVFNGSWVFFKTKLKIEFLHSIIR